MGPNYPMALKRIFFWENTCHFCPLLIYIIVVKNYLEWNIIVYTFDIFYEDIQHWYILKKVLFLPKKRFACRITFFVHQRKCSIFYTLLSSLGFRAFPILQSSHHTHTPNIRYRFQAFPSDIKSEVYKRFGSSVSYIL